MLTLTLAIAVVVTAVSGVWQIVNQGTTDAIRIGTGSVAILLLGATLQLMSPIGYLVGVVGAAMFASGEIHRTLATRRWHIDRQVDDPPSVSTRLLLHDRIDLLERRPRRAITILVSLGALGFVGLSSVWRGLDPGYRPWLFLGSLILLLPSIHAASALLRAGELRHLRDRFSQVEAVMLERTRR